MKNVKDFINGYDISHIPIGPQADLLEKVANLNDRTPWQFQSNYHEQQPNLKKRGFPIIKLGINKKFKWERGTYQKLKILKDFHSGIFNYKGFSYGNVKNIWEKEDRNKHSYYANNFKRDVVRIDDELKRKRDENAIWIDDESELNALKDKLYSDANKKIEEYISYVKMFNKLSVIEFKYFKKVGSTEITKDVSECLQDLWKFNGEKHYIFMYDDGINSRLLIFHSFKNVIMNVFNRDETTTIFKFPIGNIIGHHSIPLHRFFVNTSNYRHNYNNNFNYFSKFWFKPIIQGIKHPFINYHTPSVLSTHLTNDMRTKNPDLWTLGYRDYLNHCHGNISEVNGSPDINIVKWVENVWAWISTFRLDRTHPLTPITYSYYGHPKKINSECDDKYIDKMGIDVDGCHSRLRNFIQNPIERQGICMKFCLKETRNSCKGFKVDIPKAQTLSILHQMEDIPLKERSKIDVNPFYMKLPDLLDFIKKEKLNSIEDVKLPDLLDFKGNTSLQNDMLEWINSQRS